MLPTIPRTILLFLILGLLAGAGASSAGSGVGTVPLHLTAPAPRFTPIDGEASLEVSIPGFGWSSRPGEPRIPVKILLVAIPEGSEPQLVIQRAESELLDDLDLAPVPRTRVVERQEDIRGGVRAGLRDGRGPREAADAATYEEDYLPDRSVFEQDRDFPEAVLRLGRTGYLRSQRFVEVVFTPLLYNPMRRQARRFGEVEAEIRFALPDPGATVGVFRPEPLFEESYSSGLVNYEQGKLYRVRGPARREDPFGTSPVATEGETVVVPAAAPGPPRYKIAVSQGGLYRLDHAYLSSHAPDLLVLDPGTWSMEVDGVEVPIAIRDGLSGAPGDGDGVFGVNDILEFYGQPKSESPALLNHDFATITPDIYQANDFTDTQVYWLAAGGAPGSHLRIPAVSGAPGAPGFPVAADFGETVIWEEDDIYIPIGNADPFFSLPSLLAGSTAALRDIDIALPGIAAVAATATVDVRLRGGSSLIDDPDHRTIVWINGDVAGGIDVAWNGEMILEESVSVDQALLTDPTTVHFEAADLVGVTFDRQYIDTVRLSYRRTFEAVGGILRFTVPNQDTRFEVSGLTASPPEIYEIGRTLPGSAEADPIRIDGALPSGAPTSIYFFEVAEDTGAGAPAERSFIVVDPAALQVPDDMVLAPDPVLTTAGQAADYLVIASRAAVDATAGGALDLLLAHRLATQGLTSMVVFIDQIYDEFSFGRRDPNAIRQFLGYAFDNWRGPSGTDPPPSFVLLVGDATPDYKNTLGRTDWVDQVPTPIMFQESSIIGYHSSDNYLASFRGPDQLPDIHLGRVSTRTPAEAAGVFNKILQYETAPPAGPWKGRGVFSAGDGKFPGEADQFEAISTDLETTYFSAAPFSAPNPPLYYDNAPWNASDPVGFHDSLTAELNNGAAAFFYAGHGNFNTFGLDGFWTTQDAVALTNGLMLPLMLNANCLSGGFHFLLPEGSLGEGMLGNPSGGAIAVVAPAALSASLVGGEVADEVFAALLGTGQQRIIGPATIGMRAALWSRGAILELQSYTVLGDPATVLAIPAPPPPIGLAASAGNGEVTLSWSLPAEPIAAVRIYRAAGNPGGPYAVVTCSPLSGTSCSDDAAINATRYYYYAVSLDPDGFEGSPSNFNSDCDGGPDCVTALPLNTGPPTIPAGLVAVDAGTGGRLVAGWSANPEADVDYYTLFYGTAPATYAASATAQAGTATLNLDGLSDGVRYYMALSATNTSGFESALSGEVSAVPHLIQGIAPPKTITDLRLSVSGPDVVLQWSRPLVDIYDRPTTVAGYRIYRGPTPGFQPAAGTLIQTIADGAQVTYSDPGAVLDPASSYYLVVAFDALGLVSGAGRDLPGGIGDLGLALIAPDTVHLQWSAVTADMGGGPTLIDHYQVHATATPVGRAGLGPTTLVLDNVTTLSVDLVWPITPCFISVIAVDNRGNLSPF